jgi:hypothetical protein
MRSVQAVLFLVRSLTLSSVTASVTVYYAKDQPPLLTTSTASAGASAYTGAAAYDPTILDPPPVPNPPIPVAFDLQLQTGAIPGLSIPLSGSFLGFSVEFSVITEVRAYICGLFGE